MSNASEVMSRQDVHRGEVYYIIPDGDALSARDSIMVGGRPGVIVSNDMNNQCNGVVEIVYLSRHPHCDVPTNVKIYSTGSKCWAICGQIQTVAKRRIGKFVNQLDEKEMENINRAMALGLDAKLNLSTRDVQGHLDKWRQEMRENGDTDVLTDSQPYALDGSVETPVVSDEANNDKRMPTVMAQEQSSQPVSEPVREPVFDIESNREYIRVCAERDVYRRLYESLLQSTMVPVGSH